MTPDYPIIRLGKPTIHNRAKIKSKPPILSNEVFARRSEIAQTLRSKLDKVVEHIRDLSEEQLRAVFYRLEHSSPANPTNIYGTGLLPVEQPTPEIIVARPNPTERELKKFYKRLASFENSKKNTAQINDQWLTKLEDIQLQSPKERLSKDLRAKYASFVKQKTQFLFEIEIVSRAQGKNKQLDDLKSAIKEIEELLCIGVHGVFLEKEFQQPLCRAILRCNGQIFKTLVEEPVWIDRIRSIESRPKFQTIKGIDEAFKFSDLAQIPSPPEDAPTVCIIDSGVSPGNPFLAPVVRSDMVKNYVNPELFEIGDDSGHGSAVASLAAYHRLSLAKDAQNTPHVWIASARVLDAKDKIPENRLFSSLLEQAVKDFSKHGVKVFCLAIGDEEKVWNSKTRKTLPRKSWVARRLDQLSRQYDVVFVISTGNFSKTRITHHINKGVAYPLYFQQEECQLLDPAQAALGITVGAVAGSTLLGPGAHQSPIASKNLPSPYTRRGPGIRGETKPEVVEFGANLAFEELIKRAVENPGLGIRAASNKITPAVGVNFGTSFAAPRVAHHLGRIQGYLESLGIEPNAPLLRAFLVNSAEYPCSEAELSEFQNACSGTDDDDICHLLFGHGVPDGVRATSCSDFSTILYWQGEFETDKVYMFDVHIPQELALSNSERKMTVTVSFSPEIHTYGIRRYLSADVRWKMFRGDVSRKEITKLMSKESEISEDDVDEFILAQKDFKQKSLFETGEDENEDLTIKPLSFHPTMTQRSLGTLQNGSLHWKFHKPEFSQEDYTLAIVTKKNFGSDRVPAALVVRIEELGRNIQIYQKISQKVRSKVKT